MSDAPRPRGRPPGTEETPERLIRNELMAHLKVYKTLRELVQKKIEDRGDQLAPAELAQFMDLLRRGIVEMAKPIVAPAKAETAKTAVEEEDPEKIIAELTKGG